MNLLLLFAIVQYCSIDQFLIWEYLSFKSLIVQGNKTVYYISYGLAKKCVFLVVVEELNFENKRS